MQILLFKLNGVEYGILLKEQENRYLLVVKLDDMKIALEVSMIDRVIWTKKEAVISLPAVVSATQMCFREAFMYEGNLIGLLDIKGLVPQNDRRNLYLSIEKHTKEMIPVERRKK